MIHRNKVLQIKVYKIFIIKSAAGCKGIPSTYFYNWILFIRINCEQTEIYVSLIKKEFILYNFVVVYSSELVSVGFLLAIG